MDVDVGSVCICCICEGATRNLLLLDCLHNCCFECVQNTKCDEVVICSKCAVATSVSSCCTNTFLNVCPNPDTELPELKQCSVCSTLGRDADADTLCSDCGRVFCGPCRTVHDALLPTHTTESASNSFEEAGSSKWLCQKHGTRQEYFCTTCDKIICAMCNRDCFKDQHDLNKLKPDDVPAIFARSRERVEHAIEKLESLSSATVLIAKRKADLAATRKMCFNKITMNKNELLDCIEIEYQKLLRKMDEISDNIEEDISEKQEEAVQLEKCSQVALTYARQLLGSQMVKPLIDQHERLLMRFENLLEERVSHLESVSTEVLTMSEVDSDGDLFASCVRDKLGTLLVTEAEFSTDKSSSQSSSSTNKATTPRRLYEQSEDPTYDRMWGRRSYIIPTYDAVSAVTPRRPHVCGHVDPTTTPRQLYEQSDDPTYDHTWGRRMYVIPTHDAESAVPNIKSQNDLTEPKTSDEALYLNQQSSETTGEERTKCLESVTRKLAERYLLQPGYPRGTFFIRQSTSKTGFLALSVRDEIGDSEPSVKHYLISKTPIGRFYLDEEQQFESLAQLIRCYTTSDNGLCCKLSIPHPNDKQDTEDFATAETYVNVPIQDYSTSTTKPLTKVLPGDEFLVTCNADRTRESGTTEGAQKRDNDYDNTESEVATSQEHQGKIADHIETVDKYVSKENDALQLQDDSYITFQGISRKIAEEYLLSPEHSQGTYLIRKSQSQPGFLVLSIRHARAEDTPCVKHYVILRSSDGMKYLHKREKFQTLKALTERYKTSPDVLCTALSTPILPWSGDDTCASEVKRKMANSVRVIKKLHVGHFGEIWKGMWTNSTEVAIKFTKSNKDNGFELLKEANIMKKCCHCNIVKIYALCSKGDNHCIVMELIPNGNLLTYLKQSAKIQSTAELVNMATQITNGMSYLEVIRVVHGDLAARNILIGSSKELKIADFGLANVIEENKDAYVAKADLKLPLKWSAPEVLAEYAFSYKSDVWSFGVTLMEIVTKGRTPYAGVSNADVLSKIQKGYRMPRPEECENYLYNIILRCWRLNPKKRPSFKKLHAVFTSYTDGIYIQWDEHED